MWDDYWLYALLSVSSSLTGAVLALRWPSAKYTSVLASALTLAAAAVQGGFVLMLWDSLGRPPLRTMGEIRLWYSLFLLLAGLAVFHSARFRWILLFTALIAAVFNGINVMRPELHDQSLPPALQSAWFIPHVTIYMLSYAILACATLLSAAGLIQRSTRYLPSVDPLVYLGTGLLFLGMLSGSLWAKEAWGNYWDWDPKETWAAVTACGYLSYLHLRRTRHANLRLNYLIIVLSFLVLQMCWYGYLYLPSSAYSLHRYNI